MCDVYLVVTIAIVVHENYRYTNKQKGQLILHCRECINRIYMESC